MLVLVYKMDLNGHKQEQ